MTNGTRAVEVADPEELATLSPDRLGQMAVAAYADLNESADRLRDALNVGVHRAVRLGEILNAAKVAVPVGDWNRWLAATGIPAGTARPYMWLSRRAHVLPPGVAMSIPDAMAYLRGIPELKALDITASPWSKTDEQQAEARRLHAEGASIRSIAEAIGASWGVVKGWIDEDYAKKTKRRARRNSARTREAHALLARKEQDAAVRRAGGSAAEAYALLRRCAKALETAVSEAEDDESKDTLRAAERAIVRVEFEILKALKIERRVTKGGRERKD
jgi:hypothetical protein